LNRLEDPKNGKILPKEFHVKIPKTEATQATVAGQLLGTEIFEEVFFFISFFFSFF